MKIQELIEQLQEVVDLYDGTDVEIELYMAVQPNYPLAHTVYCVHVDEEMEGDDLDNIPNKAVVWIASGDHPSDGRSPYAPREAWSK